MRTIIPSSIFFLLVVIGGTIQVSNAQERTVGLIRANETADQGYTLLAPLRDTTTYLIDIDGYIVHTWEHRVRPGLVAYLLEDGSLLRAGDMANDVFGSTGGSGGRVQKFAWDGNLTWNYTYCDDTKCLHHDLEPLPNGNVLMIAWEYKTAEEAFAAGRDTTQLSGASLWPEHIIEVQQTDSTTGEIVWEWHAWDHLIQDFDPERENHGVVEDHPELIDINFMSSPGEDWLHFNSIDYNEALDQIVLSTPTFGELWVIDHSTTTEEAAGHTGGRSGKGGDLLYRWGNPQAYRAGISDEKQLFFQHDPQWITPGLPGEGNILVFNNGNGRPDGLISSVDELVPPVDEQGTYLFEAGTAYGPAIPLWSYKADPPTDFYSGIISGAQRLPNGNTLICSGAKGRIFEVTPEGEIVWEYVNPVTDQGPLAQGDSIPPGPAPNSLANLIFRAYRYGADYPAFDDKMLIPTSTIETTTDIENPEFPEFVVVAQNFPNPFTGTTTIPFTLHRPMHVSLAVYNILGQRVGTLIGGRLMSEGRHDIRFEADGLASGVYLYRLQAGDTQLTRPMLLVGAPQ